MKLRHSADRERIRSHFTYHFWKYLLFAAVSVFVWDLVFIQTQYKPPRDRRLQVYIQSPLLEREALDRFIKELWHSSVPGMELVEAVLLSTSSLTDIYAVVQLTAYLAAGEGDLYILTREDFKNFAAKEAFVPLDAAVKDGRLDTAGLALDAGRVTLVPEGGEGSRPSMPRTALYGIPADGLTTLAERTGLECRGMVLSIAQGAGNPEQALVFLDALVRAGRNGALPQPAFSDPEAAR